VGAQPVRLSRWRGWPFLALLAACLYPASSSAQVPTPIPIPPGGQDTLAARPDTILPQDTIPPVDLPRIRSGPPTGWATASWSWDREDYMGARELTLLELIETSAPGLLPLRGGDYGAPETVTALGFGGGRIRVFQDGMEWPSLDGGAPDLALIGLGGVEEVRVERGPGELRIHLESMRGKDPRPFSLVEAGTGDLDTNFFRGTFLHPRVVGGILGLALERVDSRGPFRREAGQRPGGWASWGRPIGSSLGVRLEVRRSNRDVALSAFPIGFSRTDWVARARGHFLEDRVNAEVFAGSSSLSSADDQGIVPVNRDSRQLGIRGAWETGPFWAGGALRFLGGDGLPSRSLEVEGGATSSYGGFYGRLGSDHWGDDDVAALALHGWTPSLRGLSAFASYGTGTRGRAIFPAYTPLPPQTQLPVDEEEDEEEEKVEAEEDGAFAYGLSDLTTLRAGAALSWRSLQLEGAWLRLEAGELPPLGLALDRAGPVTRGGTFNGWEARGHMPLPLGGFTLGGWVQRWNGEARYLPKMLYQGSIDFHDAFLPTRNLEVWGAFGVHGRTPMLVPSFQTPPGGRGEVVQVPYSQSWYADVQVRIITVHLFIRWENFTLRQNLQDFPGRVLPYTRAVYGVKWILWN
jgi:hypothetical protein